MFLQAVLPNNVELLSYRFPDRPVREALGVAQVSQVVDVAEQFVLQLRVVHHRHGTVLCDGVYMCGVWCVVWCVCDGVYVGGLEVPL